MAAARSRNNITPRRPRAERAIARRVTRARAALRAHPKTALTSGALAFATLIATAIALWPSSFHRYAPPVTARQYSTYTACLLTDSQGITGTTAAPVWAAMQSASTATTAQVRYLAVNGPDTLANTEAYLNTLALRSCNLIVTTGTQPNAAAAARAAAYKNQHFIAIDGAGTEPPNVESTQSAQLTSLIEGYYRTWKASHN